MCNLRKTCVTDEIRKHSIRKSIFHQMEQDDFYLDVIIKE